MKSSRILLVGIICLCAAGAIVFSILGQERTISTPVYTIEEIPPQQQQDTTAMELDQAIRIDASPSENGTSSLSDTTSSTAPYESTTN